MWIHWIQNGRCVLVQRLCSHGNGGRFQKNIQGTAVRWKSNNYRHNHQGHHRVPGFGKLHLFYPQQYLQWNCNGSCKWVSPDREFNTCINNLILFVLRAIWSNKNIVYTCIYFFSTVTMWSLISQNFSNYWIQSYPKYSTILVYLCHHFFENYCDCFIADSDTGEKSKDRQILGVLSERCTPVMWVPITESPWLFLGVCWWWYQQPTIPNHQRHQEVRWSCFCDVIDTETLRWCHWQWQLHLSDWWNVPDLGGECTLR